MKLSSSAPEMSSDNTTLPPNHPPIVAEETNGEPNLLLPPAACPFSGVAFDPKLWETFQAKLASNGVFQHPMTHDEDQENEENVHLVSLRGEVDDNLPFPTTYFWKGSEATNYRVQVINEMTKRSKDLVLDRSKNESLYEAVYDNPRVKEAHIRKWGAEVAENVRNGTAEVRVKIIVGEELCCWLTLEEMKTLGTNDLYQKFIKRSRSIDRIRIALSCVAKDHSHQRTDERNGSSSSMRKERLSVCFSKGPSRPTSPAKQSSPMKGIQRENGSKPSCHTLKTVLVAHRSPMDGPLLTRENEITCLDDMVQRGDGVDVVTPYYLEEYSFSASDGLTLSILDTESTTVLDLLSSSTVRAKTTMGVRVINRASKRSKDLVLQINDTDTIFDAVYDHPGVKAAHVRKWGSSVVQAVKSGTSEVQFCVWDDDTDRPWRVFSIDELKSTTTRQLYELVSESSNLITIYLQCVPVDSHTSTSDNNSFSGTSPPELKMEPLTDKASGSSVRPEAKSLCNSIDEDSPSLHDKELSSLEQQKRQTLQRLKMMNAPRRPSLRIMKDGRPQFTIETEERSTDNLVVKKPSRGNHMKLAAVPHIPRTRSFPTTRVATNDNAEFVRRNGSYSQETVFTDPTETLRKEGVSYDSSADPNTAGCSNTSWNSPTKSLIRKRLLGALDRSKANSPATEVSSQSADQHVHLRGEQKVSIPYTEGDVTLDIKPTKNAIDQQSGNEEPSRSKREVLTNHSDKLASSIALDLPSTSFTTMQDVDSNSNSRIHEPQDKLKTNDKIKRFLALQQGKTDSVSPDDDASSEVHSLSACTQNRRDMPPLKEISVIADSRNSDIIPLPPAGPQEISLPANVVKDVFPYHIILDADFGIIQVGNNLEVLLEQTGLTGLCVNDILAVTNPIPMMDGWDWTVLEKMKDKTIFFESVLPSPSGDKRKLKGTIVEVSASPKHVMLVLFPNVKNLAEMEDANLSMGDLPLHSCQRETVLFGEHSKSEVNLTNHLDQLHRDLIDSMEQQIKDRTEELAAAFRNLEAANARLAIQSARQLEHFACMSHEIRTPLNCIVGMSSLLLDDADDMEPMHADSIQMINTSGELLKAVVDDVLDYAKLESGSFEVDIKEANLQSTLNSVVHSMSEKVREKNIRLRLDYSPFLPEIVETDSRRLQQVLFNLLGNAGKFSNQNSVIDLTVSLVPVESTGVDPAETSNGQVIRFEIKDYGKGIQSKDFQTIFEPFSQASKETQTLYGGTGLGLSITSKLVHRLGGTITLQSEYGKFAEFTVNLPMRGESVDVECLSKRVENTTIVLIENPTVHDYSFTSHAIKPEPIPLNAETAAAYHVNVERCTSLEEACQRIQNNNTPTKTHHFAFLVHEELYQSGILERLDGLVGHLNHTLMTFGPDFSVDSTKDRHFKSLSGIFASSLINKIAGYIEQRRREKLLFATGSSLAPTSVREMPLMTPAASAHVSTQNPNPPQPGSSVIISPNKIVKHIQPSTTATAERQHLKILYAEDNKVNQKVLSRILTRAGITQLTIVDNGKKAVDLTETEQFDIIFMDIQMPVMDGMQATKIITERNPFEKIIFCTAHALEEFKEQTEAVGATHFISKPFRLDDIERVLQELGY